MQSPPAFQLTVQHFGVWHRALLALQLACGVVLAAWWFSPGEIHAVAAGLSSIVAWVGAGLVLQDQFQLRSFSLRWDGQLWHLGTAQQRGDEPQAGQVLVIFDLGRWMLLRFIPLDRSRVRAARGGWLPLQRPGHEANWHALRHTVYSARPEDPLAASPVLTESE